MATTTAVETLKVTYLYSFLTHKNKARMLADGHIGLTNFPK